MRTFCLLLLVISCYDQNNTSGFFSWIILALQITQKTNLTIINYVLTKKGLALISSTYSVKLRNYSISFYVESV